MLSFFTILIMWFNHHKLFTHIRRSEHALPYANGLLLLFITVTPWPTALMAEYIGHPEERIAANVFAGFYVLLAVAFNVLWRYAAHKRRLLALDADMAEVRRISRLYSAGANGIFRRLRRILLQPDRLSLAEHAAGHCLRLHRSATAEIHPPHRLSTEKGKKKKY